MELNRELIIKDLEYCINDECDKCSCTFGNCQANLMNRALSLINELTEENKAYRNELGKVRFALAEANNDRRKLTEENEKIGIENFDLVCELSRIKDDTVRKVQELIYERLDISVEGYSTEEVKSDVLDMVDQIANEMLEADK